MNTVTTPEKAPAPAAAEQAADLAALEAAAAEQQQPGQQVETAPTENTLADEIASMIKIAVATLKPVFPSLHDVYTPETTGAAAGAIAGVCQKHGWLSGGLLGRYGEEIACVAIVGPLAFATYQGITSDIEKAKAEKKPEALTNQSAPAAPGPKSKVVTFGNVAPVES